ncbi:MAG: 30S ribosomal protein S20 [bacterium]|nr:30S ribosomal protein S20 [bacterium]
MPIIKSAKKRVRVAKKASVRNSKTKRSLRSALKDFHAAVTGKKNVSSAGSKAQSNIDKAVKKGLVSKKRAARKKSQLSRAAKASGAKVEKRSTAKKTVAKKASPKKSVTKKAPSKKLVAKKSSKKK